MGKGRMWGKSLFNCRLYSRRKHMNRYKTQELKIKLNNTGYEI